MVAMDSKESKNRSELSFDKARKKTFSKRGDSCFICDRDRDYSGRQDISVHHINGDDTDHRVENLLPVCQQCHIRIHRRNEEPYSKWHEKLPKEARFTSEDLQELYKQRAAKRSRGERTILSISYRAAKEIPSGVDDKIEVSSEQAAEALVERWDEQCSSGAIHLRKAHPGMRDTEVTHSVGYRRNHTIY